MLLRVIERGSAQRLVMSTAYPITIDYSIVMNLYFIRYDTLCVYTQAGTFFL